MSKHTPAPWRVEQHIDCLSSLTYYVITTADCDGTLEPEEADANERLIQAAPEMYEAIERFANAHSHWIFCRDEGDFDDEELAEESLEEAREALIALFNKMKEGAS